MGFCDWTPDDLNPGPDCPYCSGEMCARFDGLNCQHDIVERHGYEICPGCGHRWPDPHEKRDDGTWCIADMARTATSGADPISVGPCL